MANIKTNPSPAAPSSPASRIRHDLRAKLQGLGLLAVFAFAALQLPGPPPAVAQSDARESGGATLTRTIYLVDSGGGTLEIGKLMLTPLPGDPTRHTFKIAFADAKFTEKFLSMRPFRCIDGTDQTVCHLPYPYSLDNVISDDDLHGLEYRLLFLHKGPTEYGIDACNGHYYRLMRAEDGSFVGHLHTADFNVLAVPPEAGQARPRGYGDIDPAEAGKDRFPTMLIR